MGQLHYHATLQLADGQPTYARLIPLSEPPMAGDLIVVKVANTRQTIRVLQRFYCSSGDLHLRCVPEDASESSAALAALGWKEQPKHL